VFAVREVKNGVSFWPDLTTLFLTALFLVPLIADRTEVRPEGLSFFFLALFFFLLYRFSRDEIQNEKQKNSRRKMLFLIPLVELVWINTHIFLFSASTLSEFSFSSRWF